MFKPRLCPPCAPPVPGAFKLCNEGRLAGHKDRVYDVSWSPAQSSRLASVGQTGGFVWSVDDGLATATLPGTEIMRLCWHLDGTHVFTGSSQGEIAVCAAEDGTVAATLLAGGADKDEVYGLQMLSNDGMLAAGAGCQVQQWDVNRAACVSHTTFATVDNGYIFGGEARNPEGKAYVFNLAARGRALCTAVSDGTVRLLDSQTLQTITVLTEHAQRGAPVFGVAIATASPQLATADSQGAVMLWDLRQTGRGPVAETSRNGAVHSLAFVRGVDGSAEMLVSGANDRTICLHEMRAASLTTESSVSVLSAVLCVGAAPDSGRLATAGGSGGLISDANISLWRLEACAREASDKSEAAEGAKKRYDTADGEVAQGVEKKTRRDADDDSDANGVRGEHTVDAPTPMPTADVQDGDDCCSNTSAVPAREGPVADDGADGTAAGDCEILVCQAGSCRRAGSEAVLLEIEELGRVAPGCVVRPEGCLGACDQAPNVLVLKDGEEELHTRLATVEQSAAVVLKSTGRAPNLDDPQLRQKLTGARRLRARQRAREEYKWNAATKGLGEQIANTTDVDEKLELKQEFAELLQNAGQLGAALILLTQVMNAAEYHEPDVLMRMGSLLGMLGRYDELDTLQEIASAAFDEPDDEQVLNEVTRHLASCRVQSDQARMRRVEGYARWTLASVEPRTPHSALYRFTSEDRKRGTPYLRGRGRPLNHRTWHTTLLAAVGPNEEGPLPFIERDYTPVSTWMEWDKGLCDILIKIYPTGAATSWLHRQPLGSHVWLSEPMTTLNVPALVPDASALGSAATEAASVLLVLAGTGIAVGANVLQHADPATCFGTSRKPPLKAPIRMIYACRRDDVLVAAEIAKWCVAETGRARLQRCLVAVSAPSSGQGVAAVAPFSTSSSDLGLAELAKLANVDVVDGRLTQELLQSELAPLQALGQCRVLVSGPASFNGAVREMLGASGVTADAITILEA